MPGEISRNRSPSPPPATIVADRFVRKDWLLAAVLVAAVFLVYQPAWHGGFVWDDDCHVTRPELRSWHGLYRIWFDVGATLQYYPLLHSVFWFEHALWGDATLGYHLVNISFHALAALLAALLLRRLAIPGAYLAAAIFALHPVHVESVAWITEQKNTLSTVFYLAAMLVYLRFDQTRKPAWYTGAVGLFVLALLSKTVTATLPAALLVIFWWQRGRLSWRRDVLPLLPLFVVGAGGGLITAWWELQLNQCVGPEFEFTLVERLLLAGRAVWFHLGKLFWPENLLFVYPRWQIDSRAWWQYLFPLGAAGLLAAGWAIRRRSRAPLAAVLLFGGSLFPVLGFFNLYTFRFFAGGQPLPVPGEFGDRGLRVGRRGNLAQPAATVGAAARLLPLRNPACRAGHADLAGKPDVRRRGNAVSATLARNPDCWMLYNNLAVLLADKGRVDQAIAHYQKALEIKPDYAEAHCNLANTLAGCGQIDAAIVHYRKALEIKPDYSEAHNNLGAVLAGQGQTDEAMIHYRKSLDANPDNAQAHTNLGVILANRGQLDEAVDCYQKALAINPDLAEAHANLANLLARRGRLHDAELHFREARRLAPFNAAVCTGLGMFLQGRGQVEDALACFDESLRLQPNQPQLLNNVAWIRATNPDPKLRDGARAVAAAEFAIKQLPDDVHALDTLAAAYAEATRFPLAIQTAQKALELAVRQNKQDAAESLRAKLALYAAGTPFRDTRSAAAPTPASP